MSTHAITAGTLVRTIDSNEIVVLDVWAEWCEPCDQFASTFERTALAHRDVFFGKIDAQREGALVQELRVQALPTLLLYRRSAMVFRKAGGLTPTALDELIRQVKDLGGGDGQLQAIVHWEEEPGERMGPPLSWSEWLRRLLLHGKMQLAV